MTGLYAHKLPPTETDDALLAFAFRDLPVFRVRFDRHVRQWDKHMRRRLWRAYWSRPEFAAVYDAEVARRLFSERPPQELARLHVLSAAVTVARPRC